MRLHLDKYAFSTIIDNISKRSSVRHDLLEKDYYVTLLLKELAMKQDQNYSYFKGGTALYKALKSIRRFSEDIDLTINVSDCKTNSAKQKRLKEAVLNFKSLAFEKKISDSKGSIEAQYKYDSLYEVDLSDALQRFGNVRVEGTNFEISEPFEQIEISTHLFELATHEEKDILINNYDVKPFLINTLTLERIFIDKLFAAEHYCRISKYRDLAKHIYDLTILSSNFRIIAFLNDRAKLAEMILLQRNEEINRYGGITDDTSVCKFQLFNCLDNESVIKEINYVNMVYVFNKNDILSLDSIKEALEFIKKAINE